MIALGKAELIESQHSSGVLVKSWDLTPFGEAALFLGPVTSPLPPPGSTRDIGAIRIDTGTGEVWQLESLDPPPALGPSGRVAGGGPSMMVIVGLGVLGWMLGLGGLRRRR